MRKPIKNHICEDHVFSTLFEKHAKNLHDFLYYKYGGEYNPKDIVQDAFIKLWQNCKTIPPDKAKSFLFTTANNLMLNVIAHKKVVLRHQKSKPKSHTNQDPEFLMLEQEYLEKLEKAIAKLTEAQRVAFLMNRVEGKRFKEIAAILDISVKGVEKRVYGALKKLRKDIDGL